MQRIEFILGLIFGLQLINTFFLFFTLKNIKQMDSNEQAEEQVISTDVGLLTTAVGQLIAQNQATAQQLAALSAQSAGTDQTAELTALANQITTNTANITAALTPPATPAS